MAILTTKRVATTVLAVAFCGWAIDVCCEFGLVDRTTKRLVSAAAWMLLFRAMVPLIRHYETVPRRRFTIYGIFAVGGIGATLSLLSNMPIAESMPSKLPALDAVLRLLMRTAVVAWYVSPFLLIQMYIRSYVEMKDRLEERVNERTRELTNSNNRLQEEIVGKMVVSNELYRTKAELRKNIDGTVEKLGAADVLRKERLGAIGQVSAGISHELNNALTPIVSYSKLLLATPNLSSQQREWLQRITQASNDATRVVDNLQQFHTNRSGEGFGPCSPVKIIEQTIDATQPTLLNGYAPKIDITTEFRSNGLIDAEPDQICLLLTNLILNAVDSVACNSKDGRIKIVVSDDSNTLSISVQDNGKGMSPEEVKCCFEPFYTTKHGRPGLGLSVSHGIVRRHGGTFDIETNKDETTFCVRFPLSKTVTKTVEPDTAVKQEFDDTRILLVEDDAAVRVALTDILEAVGADVTSAENGPTALELVSTASFDIMITDLGLPEMNGAELIEKTRMLSDVPIVLMSGWPKAKVVKQLGSKQQPDAMMPKPARFADVVRVITAHARKRPAMKTESSPNG